MKFFILIYLTFLFNLCYSQVTKVKEYYANGHLNQTGKYFTYSTRSKKLFCSANTRISKKIGKWVYYYQNGNLNRIEFYKTIKDCNNFSTPDGEWKYWAENGKPVLTIQDGQNPIEDFIPYWSTPNKSTPDYYNQFRRLIKVPDNLSFSNISPQRFSYVGIILYHHPSQVYSEYITGEFKTPLEANKSYCLKIRLCLSQNSGYYLNKLGVYFSTQKPSIPNTGGTQQCLPQVLFNEELSNREGWSVLCDSFTSVGNEKHITIGRFSSIWETVIKKITPVHLSEGEYNQSAYYLFDNMELYENTKNNCLCGTTKSETINAENARIDFDSINLDDSLKFDINKTIILKNIQFEFDKSVLLPLSLQELEKLRRFLVINNAVTINITGHTDNMGTDDYNYNLSLSRAKAVFNWLNEHGIAPERIRYEGSGAKKPIVDNTTEGNRFKNRRVEFKISRNY